MARKRHMQPDEIESLKSLKLEAKNQRNKAIEEMAQEFENDTQPDGTPYTVFADHLTDRKAFIQGLRTAGFEIHAENILVAPSHDAPETVIVTFASGAHAKRAMLALHLRDFKGMQGKKMCLTKAAPQMMGPDDWSPCAPVPTYAAVMQAMGVAFYERAVAPRRAEEAAARLAKERSRSENRRRNEEARLARETSRSENRRRDEEARLAKLARKADNIRMAQEAKELNGAERRTRDEEARLAKQAMKAANIQMAQEAKLAKDARRAQHVNKMEEAKLRKEAKMMAQWNASAPEEELQDLSDGMEDIEAVGGEESGDLSDGFEGMQDIEAMAGEEPEVSAWFEAMKQQHRDREDLETALLGSYALLPGF